MNSLILTLDAGAGCCLPIAYQQLTQGALYAAWRGSYPQLHDDGFDGDGQIFRLFTFGPLEGRYRVQGNEITFTDLVRLEVRSPVEDLLYALGKSLTKNSALRLGRCVLPLRDLRSEDHYWFAAPLPVRMVSPLTLHKSLPGGKTRFLCPDDDAFAAQLIANTAHKLAACRSTADPSVTLCPMGTRLPRKRVTQFKGIYLTGWEGDFLLDGDPETLCLLYQTGLGDRNSQGFGMFRLLL
ncbi:CRISPR-associated endoribonuclease Cas6 [Gemmiger formicilis]|jgi:CRISPR-associated endoribonuclease cas6|uniref:CRISPR-associated endoribonuclease Cas6 n=1 Tax=Gemmiger formicilis TaxID=745368 RepID=UPI003A93D8B9